MFGITQFEFRFFKEEDDVIHDEVKDNLKKCVKCKKRKRKDQFPFFSTKDCGRKNSCKKCNNKHAKIRNLLKKTNPKPKSNICALCESSDKKLVIDHCHHTGSFRGWICNDCNTGLGRFKDDVEELRKAIGYLKKTTPH